MAHSERASASTHDPRRAGPSVTVLCGGVGAARLLRGAVLAMKPDLLSAVVNVGDDTSFHGLRVCPDLDTITYTVSGSVNPNTGWGLAGESWRAIEQLRRHGQANGRSEIGWFALGDLDIGTHLYRTTRLNEGARLTDVTAELCKSFGVPFALLPISDDQVATTVDTPLGTLGFQDYFVRLQHDVTVGAVHFVGADTARVTPEAFQALHSEVCVIAPSNPIVSIGPLRALPAAEELLRSRRSTAVAISPLVSGKALKGPADRLMAELGYRSDALGVAQIYADIAATIVIDEQDAPLATQIADLGVECVVAQTIMTTAEDAKQLFEVAVDAVVQQDGSHR